jgi:hypothetical protein
MTQDTCSVHELSDKAGLSRMRQKFGISIGLLLLVSMLAGCTLTESAFAKTTSNAGSAFAAAMTTLAYEHEGKIMYAYAASSFVNFQSELNGTDQTLLAQGGANSQTVRKLLAVYTPAMRVINAPCLSNTCDWRAQVTLLQRASQAFLEAGNT